MSTPAGWYPQPDGQQRYWDGELWTEHFAPGVHAAANVLPLLKTEQVTGSGGRSFDVAATFGWGGLALAALSGALSSGFSGAAIMMGLFALVVGVIALARGRVAWARLGSRAAGGVAVGAAMVLFTVGGVTAPAITPPASQSTKTSSNSSTTTDAAAEAAAQAAAADTAAAEVAATEAAAAAEKAAAEASAQATADAAAAEKAAAEASAQATADAAAAPPAAGTALAAVATLTVKGRAPKTGYTRAQFGQAWYDTDRNGCDTRNDILRRDLHSRQMKNACKVLAGTLAPDPYTATSIRFVYGGASEVDIDHLVALSDAWQKGAATWPAGKRLALANDPLNLLAVDSSTNRSKGDGDAATWLPPNKAFRCTYVARQVAVKGKYAIWVTAAERDAMNRVLRTCPSMVLPGPGSASTLAAVPRAAPPAPAPRPAPAPAPAPAPVPSAKHYANCTAMHLDYKGGVALPGAVDHRASGHARYAPFYSAALYNANSGSDRDKDGIACEA